ncbi:ADP-heptose:LPS heptosyltransferase [Mucilaginibacter gracilis]|uniref:ADP-heptose:LPS heptosyltransferase n=1 Tax=Mucilaginibacter gracilis TaxID=423350 RepID=A0A495J1Q1_9SPHI|nr:glycosyltransferase family 9 protein [Mucilaginibacter gracilis]RKR82258.1 ADP-heptose:LPS heptosyltransferase [Mucilaginibacter gracilis]
MNVSNRKILIYRLGSLGDTVIALPCFNKIRETFPYADITLLTNRPVAAKAAPLEAVLGQGYFYDHIFDYPVGTRSLFVLFSLIRKIRRLKIDTIVNITASRSKQAAIRDRLFFKLAGIKHLIGFPKDDRDFNLSIDPLTNEYEWEAIRLSRRINELGKISINEDRYWDLHLTEAEIKAGENALSSIDKQKPFIAVSAGTKMQAKDWEDDNWVGLISRLKDALPGWGLVMIGAPDEADRANECITAWGHNSINLCGKSSPRVSAAVLKQAFLFVGHDSGPMHLAAAVGIPCVAIFAARNLPRQWYPRGNKNRIIYHKTDCAGCGLEICIIQKKKCILSITIDEVHDEIVNLINEGQHALL